MAFLFLINTAGKLVDIIQLCQNFLTALSA